MREPTLLGRHELASAAFHLLGCSSGWWYTELALRLAADTGLALRLRSSPDIVHAVLSRASHLRIQVSRSTARDVGEIELAVLLAALRDVAQPDAERLLVQCALDNGETMAWIGALARRILAERASNRSDDFVVRLPVSAVYNTRTRDALPWPAQRRERERSNADHVFAAAA